MLERLGQSIFLILRNGLKQLRLQHFQSPIWTKNSLTFAGHSRKEVLRVYIKEHTMVISINSDQRLFVFQESHGVSALGFDVVFNHCRELMQRIVKLKSKIHHACLQYSNRKSAPWRSISNTSNYSV